MNYSFENDKNAYMALEYCPGGELYRLIGKTQKGLKTPLLKYHAACLIVALECLHKNNVIYKDLKTENVVISKNGLAKLTDFGLSVHQYDASKTIVDSQFIKK